MMIPFEEPKTEAEQNYNKSHKKCRCSVERALGVWKSRFRCICKQSGGGIQFDVETCYNIITATAVLHNYCRDRNITTVIEHDIQQNVIDERQRSIGCFIKNVHISKNDKNFTKEKFMEYWLQFGHERYKFYFCNSFDLLKLFFEIFWLIAKK